MIKILYPEKKSSVKIDAGKELVFCIVRKSWLVLTPEEWVRQNFLLYLIEVLGFPPSLIAVEKQIILSEVKKRFDIVVYDRASQPYIVVECKEMNEPLSPKVLDQALRYNAVLQANYIMLTNGVDTIGFENSQQGFIETDSIKMYK